MTKTRPDGFCLRPYRFSLLAALALGSSTGFYSVPASAKYNNVQTKVPTDPCAKMSGYMAKRVEQMKELKSTIDKEKSVPNTLAGVFDLMQGRTYVDQPKLQKLTQMRREADDLNNMMHATGCTVVDIDKEMTKPLTHSLPSGKQTGDQSPSAFSGRSAH